MKYLHTMVRVSDIDASLDFYCNKLGLVETRRYDNEQGRFTLVFVAPPGQEETPVELTYNWDPEEYGEGRNFGHLAFEVENIHDTCQRLMGCGRDHQPAAARRPHGVHPFARQCLRRALAGRRRPRTAGALAVHGQYRTLVRPATATRGTRMGLHNSERRFGTAAMTLHWLIAVCVIGLLAVGKIMTGESLDLATKFQLYQLHKSFGVLVFMLMVLRLCWRWTQTIPAYPQTMQPWEKGRRACQPLGLFICCSS